MARRSALRVKLRDHRPLVFDRVRGRRRPGCSAPPRRRPPAGRASSDGALPARTASASVAANGASATPVIPMPAPEMRAVGAEPDDSPRPRPSRSRRPCARASRRRRRCPVWRRGMRTSVRTSVGSIAVWKVSRKNPRAAIDRSPDWLRQMIVAPSRSAPPASPTPGRRARRSRRSCPSCGPAGRRSVRSRRGATGSVSRTTAALVDLAMGRAGTDRQVVVGHR